MKQLKCEQPTFSQGQPVIESYFILLSYRSHQTEMTEICLLQRLVDQFLPCVPLHRRVPEKFNKKNRGKSTGEQLVLYRFASVKIDVCIKSPQIDKSWHNNYNVLQYFAYPRSISNYTIACELGFQEMQKLHQMGCLILFN